MESKYGLLQRGPRLMALIPAEAAESRQLALGGVIDLLAYLVVYLQQNGYVRCAG